ncbi:hypothetical protein PQX77_013268, partial [Marasmius sp. AFHP31]
RQGSWPTPPSSGSSVPQNPRLKLQPPTTIAPSPLSAPLSLSSSSSSSSPYSSTHSPYGYSSPRRQNPTSLKGTPTRGSVLQAHSHHSQPSTASEIIPNLFVSDLAFAENPALLEKYRITHILSVLPERVAIPDVLGASSSSRGGSTWRPVRMQLSVEDFPFAELAEHLPGTTDFINGGLRQQGRVLVHCAEGISRSVSVVAAFLMAEFRWSPEEAVRYVKGKRPIANPNFGFVKQLGEYGTRVLRIRA